MGPGGVFRYVLDRKLAKELFREMHFHPSGLNTGLLGASSAGCDSVTAQDQVLYLTSYKNGSYENRMDPIQVMDLHTEGDDNEEASEQTDEYSEEDCEGTEEHSDNNDEDNNEDSEEDCKESQQDSEKDCEETNEDSEERGKTNQLV
ncbi:unnamed protein product [Calypogeia fissa]